MSSTSFPPLKPEASALVVVDLQDRLLAAMINADAIVAAAERMIRAANVLQVPIIVTEQYPNGLGKTCNAIQSAIDNKDVKAVEKLRFTGCVDDVVNQLASLQRRSVIVVGVEAHVCLQQTVLDLLRLGYQPYVCVDAITSRRALDREVAIERMRDAGAVITTTESVIYELLDRAGTDQFKQILKIVK